MAEEKNSQNIKKKRKPSFQRTKFRAYVKLGAGQKSKRKYRKATGRHNKIRQHWKGRPPRVDIGYRNDKRIRDVINGRIPIVVNNLKDLMNVKDNQIIIIGKIGAKKKLEFIKEIEKKKLEVLNLNINKFKKLVDRRMKIKEEKRKKKTGVTEKKEKKDDKKQEETKEIKE